MLILGTGTVRGPVVPAGNDDAGDEQHGRNDEQPDCTRLVEREDADAGHDSRGRVQYCSPVHTRSTRSMVIAPLTAGSPPTGT